MIMHCVFTFFSYVIKLFDRRVDLAQFSTETPLYILVREWMKNKPYTNSSCNPPENTIDPKILTVIDTDSLPVSIPICIP